MTADARLDPLSEDFQQCPHAALARVRRTDPVHHVAHLGLWFVTRRDLVVQAVRDPDVFSSRFGSPQSDPSPAVAARIAEIKEQGWPQFPTLLTEDRPAHDHYRKLVLRAFGRRDVGRLEPGITELVDGMLDTLLAAGGGDVVAELASPLTLTVIARLLGLDDAVLPDLRRWSDQFVAAVGARLDDDARVYSAEQFLEFQRFVAGELDRRRGTPRDDLLTLLVRAHHPGVGEDMEEPLSTAACLNIVSQLVIAGNETTTKLFAGVVARLAEEPRWWEWLREDPAGRAPAVVEEGLRYVSPTQGMFRVVTRDTELGGTPLPAGARVLLSYGAANRDEDVFDDPDAFDPQRPRLREHLAFGHGVHHCVGAALARLETRVALTRLARRVARIELVAPPRNSPSFLLHGPERLDVRLTSTP